MVAYESKPEFPWVLKAPVQPSWVLPSKSEQGFI